MPPSISSATGLKSKGLPILEFPDSILPSILPEFQFRSTLDDVQLYDYEFEFINNISANPCFIVLSRYTDILETPQIATPQT